jgi:hypothetical protein
MIRYAHSRLRDSRNFGFIADMVPVRAVTDEGMTCLRFPTRVTNAFAKSLRPANRQ